MGFTQTAVDLSQRPGKPIVGNEAKLSDQLLEKARAEADTVLTRLLDNVKTPLVILLTALGVLSFLTGDQRATAVIFVMVLLGVVLRFYQEMRADNAAEKLKAMVSHTATVVRDGQEEEIPLKVLAPGDIIRLAAGDMVPADARVLSAMEFVRSVEERDLNLPVRNAMTGSQDVWVVDEYRSLIQQACDFLAQFAEVLVANADSTTIP